MNLYHISQTQNDGYDTFSEAVVVAKSPKSAKTIHPGGGEWNSDTWATSQEYVKAELVGKARPGLLAGAVICASFHAG